MRLLLLALLTSITTVFVQAQTTTTAPATGESLQSVAAQNGDFATNGPTQVGTNTVTYQTNAPRYRRRLPAVLRRPKDEFTNAVAAAYSTEATMSVQKDEGTYKVLVRVSQLVEQDGKLTEHLIAEPRIQSAPGVPATLYSGLQPSNPNYTNEDNVTVDVTWPYPNESGVALCAVVIKRGDKIVSKSKLQLQVEGQGRTPLIVMVRDVDPKSVQVVEEKSKAYVLLEFTGKTKEEVKKVANDNYGNKVHVRDVQGRVTEGGLSFGTYKEIGMSVHYESKVEAEHVASILRGENPK